MKVRMGVTKNQQGNVDILIKSEIRWRGHNEERVRLVEMASQERAGRKADFRNILVHVSCTS